MRGPAGATCGPSLKKCARPPPGWYLQLQYQFSVWRQLEKSGLNVWTLTPSSSSMMSLPTLASVVHLQLLMALTAQRLWDLNLQTSQLSPCDVTPVSYVKLINWMNVAGWELRRGYLKGLHGTRCSRWVVREMWRTSCAVPIESRAYRRSNSIPFKFNSIQSFEREKNI